MHHQIIQWIILVFNNYLEPNTPVTPLIKESRESRESRLTSPVPIYNPLPFSEKDTFCIVDQGNASFTTNYKNNQPYVYI